MIELKVSGGDVLKVEVAQTLGEIAATVYSKKDAKTVIAALVNGQETAMDATINGNADISFITRADDVALDFLKRDAIPVMALAVKRLYPHAKVTTGSTVADGFYLDVDIQPHFTPEDLTAIEKEMGKIVDQNLALTQQIWTKDEAVTYFKQQGNPLAAELAAESQSDTVTVCKLGDDHFSLSDQNIHVPSTKHVGKAVKLLSSAGMYWKGDASNQTLSRIYGTVWRNDRELKEFIQQREEIEKRDHRRLGTAMDLFHFQEEAPGQVFWHPNGWVVYTELLNYMREKIRRHGYQEINTPQMLSPTFWKASGHWDKYNENMFIVGEDGQDEQYALKPMSCPGGAQVYKHSKRSYRDLPLRMAEFGSVFRKEATGARHGLMRVQAFTQDDAHIFCDNEQLEEEVVRMCALIGEVYSDLGLAQDVTINFSTRPEKRIGSEEDWNRAEKALRNVLDKVNMKWVMNEGDGAFYAPKLDFVLKDALGRSWQCGTIQVDMNMPGRLGLEYVGSDGQKHKPNMVHRAILGSFERFIGIMIEHYAGALPVWLAPVQATVATITQESDRYAQGLHERLLREGVRSKLDIRNEKIGYKLREHFATKMPYVLIAGRQEATNETVAVRRLGSSSNDNMTFEQAVAMVRSSARAPL